jgi:hypothetical protein
MTRQEIGGIKSPSGATLAIPTKYVRDRIGRGGRIPKRLTPSKVLQNKRGFIQSSDGPVHPAIWLRTSTRPRPLSPLYWLVPKARVKPAFGFEKTIRATVAKSYPKHFPKALAKAIATAK